MQKQILYFAFLLLLVNLLFKFCLLSLLFDYCNALLQPAVNAVAFIMLMVVIAEFQ